MKLGKDNKILILSSLAVTVLILDCNTAAKGASEGINVCIRTVVPSLFPFIFLSSLISSILLSGGLPCSRIISRIYQIPHGSEGILLAGLMGGYPVGAKCIGEAVESGRLSHTDGNRMIVFCNAAGPAFLFGMAGGIFSEKWVPWCLWGIHLFSGLCIARLFPAAPSKMVQKTTLKSLPITQRLRQSVRAMGEICGWIILMRILLEFLRKWFLIFLPETWSVFTAGIFELSNGCIALSEISNSGLRFVLCGAFLGFGGLCVALQTSSVASVVNQRMYLLGKVVQGMISFLTAYIVQFFVFDRHQRAHLPEVIIAVLLILPALLIYFFAKLKKSCGNLEPIGV